MPSERIAKALNLLERNNAWNALINQMNDIYEDVPLETPLQEQLEDLLWDLVLLIEKANSEKGCVPLNRLFQRRLAELPCWHHRAFVEADGEIVVWNPLDLRYREFKAAHTEYHEGGTPRHYFGESPYPAIDIIRKWAQTRTMVFGVVETGQRE